MSKLYNKYCELKSKNNETLYLFKSGIFFICLEDDARLLEKLLNLKVIPLNENVVKCGFPIQKISKYIEILTANNIPFQIIDKHLDAPSDIKGVINDIKFENIFRYIKTLDINTVTPIECFKIVLSLQEALNEKSNIN